MTDGDRLHIIISRDSDRYSLAIFRLGTDAPKPLAVTFARWAGARLAAAAIAEGLQIGEHTDVEIIDSSVD